MRAQGIENRSRLAAAAAAELQDHRLVGNVFRDVMRMALKEPLVRSREPVFRQQRDRIEQRRTQIVVKIFGRQFLLACAAQSRAYIVGELLLSRNAWRREDRHDRFLLHRSTQWKPA